MDGGRDLAASRRFARLAEKFHDKQYRDSYVASHTRGVLAQQMRNFRGELSQAEYAVKIGKQKTVIGRLENPGYAGWSLRTALEVARKQDVAVFCRFVDFSTFLKYSGDLSAEALCPHRYDPDAIPKLAQERTTDDALSSLFGGSNVENGSRPRALDAMQKASEEVLRCVPADDDVVKILTKSEIQSSLSSM